MARCGRSQVTHEMRLLHERLMTCVQTAQRSHFVRTRSNKCIFKTNDTMNRSALFLSSLFTTAAHVLAHAPRHFVMRAHLKLFGPPACISVPRGSGAVSLRACLHQTWFDAMGERPRAGNILPQTLLFSTPCVCVCVCVVMSRDA